MKIKSFSFILLFVLLQTTMCFDNSFAMSSRGKNPKLYALYDSSDSGTTMTLEQANKNAEAAENKKTYYYPFYFSPLIIVIIALASGITNIYQ